MISDPVGAPADPDLLHLQLLPVVTQGFRAGSSIPEADPVTSLRLMPRNSSGQMEGRIYISGIESLMDGEQLTQQMSYVPPRCFPEFPVTSPAPDLSHTNPFWDNVTDPDS